MADITAYQDLFLGQIETPTAPNPRLASAISATDTNITLTNAILDEDGNVPTKPMIIGIKSSQSGYVESVYVPKYVYTGDTHTNTLIDNIADTSKLAVGMRVSGTGVQAGTTILTIASPTSITLSQATTATNTGVSLTFLSLSADGLKMYGVVRGIARSGVNGIDFESSVLTNREAHAQDDQVRINISALLFEMFNKVTSGTIANGQPLIKVGNGQNVDIYYYVNNGDANPPYFKYDASSNIWVYSDDGVNELPMGGAGSLTGGVATEISVGAINVKYDSSTMAVNGSNELYVLPSAGAFGNGSDGALTISSGTVNIPVNTLKQYTTISITGTGVLSTASTTWGVLDLHATGNVNINGGGSINVDNKVSISPTQKTYYNGLVNIEYKENRTIYSGYAGSGGAAFAKPFGAGVAVTGGIGVLSGIAQMNLPTVLTAFTGATGGVAVTRSGVSGGYSANGNNPTGNYSGAGGGGIVCATSVSTAVPNMTSGAGGSGFGANGGDGSVALTSGTLEGGICASGGGGGGGQGTQLGNHSVSIITGGNLDLSGGTISTTGPKGQAGGNGGKGKCIVAVYSGSYAYGGTGGQGGSGGRGGDIILMHKGTYTSGTLTNTGGFGNGGTGGTGQLNGVDNATYKGADGANGLTGETGSTIVAKI